MTTAKRAYINKEFNQFVDDECLRYRSIPMAVVNTILKQKRNLSDFTGVKPVFNNVPARPINLNALATTIARMNGVPYFNVENIAMKIGAEEVTAIKEFVKGNKDPFQQVVAFSPQVYIKEQATSSTTGIPLVPSTTGRPAMERYLSKKREIELLLGDEAQTYNTPGFVNLKEHGEALKSKLQVYREMRTPTPRMMKERRQNLEQTNMPASSSYIPASSESLGKGRSLEERITRGTFQGTEPNPQIRHQNRDSVFGESYSKSK